MYKYVEKITFWVHLLLAGICLYILVTIEKNWFIILDKDLQSNFILNLQFATTELKLIDMLRFLSCEGKRAVAFYLGLEYAFMLLIFTWFIRCHLFFILNTKKIISKRIGVAIIIFQSIALVMDMVENAYQINWLMDSEWQGNFTLYYWFVRIKWAVVCLGVVHIIYSFLFNNSTQQKLNK